MREPSRTLAGKCKSALLPSWDQLDEAATVLQWGSDRRAIDIVSVRNIDTRAKDDSTLVSLSSSLRSGAKSYIENKIKKKYFAEESL